MDAGFYLNLPIGGVVAVLLALIHIPDRISAPLPLLEVPRHLDLPGCVLFIPSALMLLLALQFGGNDYAWNSSVVIGLFVGSGVMAILFVLWEHHVGDEKAMIPLGMLKKRVVCTSALVGGINMSVTLVGSYYLPMYFQSVKGETPFKGGVDYLPTILAQLISAVTSGALGRFSSLSMEKRRHADFNRSWADGILSSMGFHRRRLFCGWKRTHLDLGAYDSNRYLDRIPDHSRNWPWLKHANG